MSERQRANVSGALALVLVAALGSAAEAGPTNSWLRDHVAAEATGVVGWRSAIGLDPSAPGFEGLGAGVDALLGVEIAGGVGVAASGHLVYGAAGTHPYNELVMGLGVQLRLKERLRASAGLASGQLTRSDQTAVLLGGFLMANIDLLPLSGGRFGIALTLRLDGDYDLGAHSGVLPIGSMALCSGIGLRY
jgi:hypothetical protein